MMMDAVGVKQQNSAEFGGFLNDFTRLAAAAKDGQLDGCLPSRASFASTLCEHVRIRKLEPRLKQLLHGQHVIDLGAGTNSRGYELACLGEAASYTACDAFNPTVPAVNGCMSGRSEDVLTIPARVIPYDMVTVLRAIPDRSVSVLAIGLHYILDDETEVQVSTLLGRVIADKGCCICYPLELGGPFPRGFDCVGLGNASVFTRRD